MHTSSIPRLDRGTFNTDWITKAVILTALVSLFSSALACQSFDPKIEADTVAGSAPLNITFTNSGSDADEHSWDFGDDSNTETTGATKTVTHTFTKAGSFTVNLTATSGEDVKTLPVTVTVEPGPIARVEVEDWDGTIGAGSSTAVQAVAYDEFGNEVTDADLVFEVPADAGNIDNSGNFQVATSAADFADGLKVTANRGAESVSASVELEVTHAPLSSVNIEPSALDVQAGETVDIEIVAMDEHGNTVPGASVQVSAPTSLGTVTAAGRYTATETLSGGSSASQITVNVTHNDVSREAFIPVTVSPGPLALVSITPSSLEDVVTIEQEFSAMATDEYGNEVPGAEITWSADSEAGSIDEDGMFTAGFSSGEFTGAITATALAEGEEASGAVDVILAADVFDQVVVDNSTVEAGSEEQLSVTAADKYGNEVEGVILTWALLDESVGSLSDSGMLTPTTRAGDFPASVSVEGTDGTTTASAEVDVTVTPGELTQVVMLPGELKLGIEQAQQYVAAAGDRYGNRIADASFTWSADEDAGTIGSDGMFTASATPGNYSTAVTVTASHNGEEASASSSLEIEPDRIMFYSERDDEFGFFYTMNLDGSDVTRMPFGQASTGAPSFSPDGRRIVVDVYSILGGLLLADDTGETFANPSLLVANPAPIIYYAPEWSPDGSKIAVVALDVNNETLDLALIDIDGSNVTMLTNSDGILEFSPSWSPDGRFLVYNEGSSSYTDEIYRIDVDSKARLRLTNNAFVDYQPAYSPDGTKIVFTSRRDGNDEIYVMDANGSNQVRITNSSGIDSDPRWSPDGTQVLFTSDRDGDREIFVMNADGTEVQKLTSNTDWDSDAEWMPRKTAVTVNEDALLLPSEEPAEELTVQELTAQFRESSVKIETDLGSGSGFVVRSDGMIMTNNHVIQGASSITVTLDDGTEYDATVVGRDMAHDLAIVKIDATDLPALSFGAIGDNDLGAEVVVLGYPLGSADLNVTRGVVSSVIADHGRGSRWIQTDAAVNPGNSGGAMLNMRGEVVGIVTLKHTSADNVGLAVDSTTILTFLDRLLDGETVYVN